MPGIMLKFALTFLCAATIHIVTWHIHRPTEYRAWVPALLAIFVGLGAVIAALLVYYAPLPPDPRLGGPLLEWCAIALLQTSVGLVYTFGYTLMLVGSPSLLILQRLSAAPGGLRIDEIGLPMTGAALVGMRIDNLMASGWVTGAPGPLLLTLKGRRLTRAVVLYRHVIGLRDGEGG